MAEQRSLVSFDEGYESGLKRGAVMGLRNAIALVNDLKERTVGSGMLTDTFRHAYEAVEQRLLEAIVHAEARLTSGGARTPESTGE